MGEDVNYNNLVPRRVYYRDEVVFNEGDEGRFAYLIESGTVGIYKVIDSKEQLIRKLGKGYIFGELALISPGPRSATVRVIEDASIVSVPEDKLKEKIDESDPFIRCLLPALIAQMRDLSQNFRRAPSTIDDRLDYIKADIMRLVDHVDTKRRAQFETEVKGFLGNLRESLVKVLKTK